MSLHAYNGDCEHHDEPLAEDARVTGRVVEWRGTCACGWSGPWHSESTHVAAAAAREDYRAHVEADLGAEAYYDAPAGCRNCGSEHVQGVLVGMHVSSTPCVRCGTTMLQPRNDTWDESRPARTGWL